MTSAEYPPPQIDALLMEKVSRDAIKPSYEQMAGMARELGSIIIRACAPQMPIEVFDVMCVMPRGGFFVNDVLTHAFGFHGRRLQVLGATSYKEDGITKADEVRFTQLPKKRDIAGKRVLLTEDVCDTGHTFNEAKNLLLSDKFEAAEVVTAAIFYKPGMTETDFVPDYFVKKTNRWVVFPGEVYEQLGPQSLNQSLWLPPSARQE